MAYKDLKVSPDRLDLKAKRVMRGHKVSLDLPVQEASQAQQGALVIKDRKGHRDQVVSLDPRVNQVHQEMWVNQEISVRVDLLGRKDKKDLRDSQDFLERQEDQDSLARLDLKEIKDQWEVLELQEIQANQDLKVQRVLKVIWDLPVPPVSPDYQGQWDLLVSLVILDHPDSQVPKDLKVP